MATKSPTNIIKLKTTKIFTTYNIYYLNHIVHTTVTRSPTVVTSWINQIKDHLAVDVVGLDTEGMNPISVLQFCVGDFCLIYQIIHSQPAPSSLRNFLGDLGCKFAGVAVAQDAKRMAKDYELGVASMMDVARVAAKMGKVRVNAGLKEVTKAILGWEIDKPKKVTLSQWDKEVLDDEQITYACIDAFVGYYIAKELIELCND